MHDKYKLWLFVVCLICALWFATPTITTKCYGIDSTDNSVCSGNGFCQAADDCDCDPGYTGNTCNLAECNGKTNQNGACSGHGDCTSPNTCSCNTGYTGQNCETFSCFGKAATSNLVCSKHGSCSGPDTCSCNTGYSGKECNEYLCYGKPESSEAVCSGNGQCLHVDSCLCDNDWSGDACDVPVCFNSTTNGCGPNGVCKSPDTCQCNNGYTGNQCELVTCYGIVETDNKVCSENGVCQAPDDCLCASGYIGNKCQTPKCFGTPANESSVCSSHGDCVGVNNCHCKDDYVGLNCEIHTCYGMQHNDTSVCSCHGTCIGRNKCVCEAGYVGDECETKLSVCNGKNETDPEVCSTRGVCKNDKCKCLAGSTGDDCEFYTCNSINSSDPSVCSARGECLDIDTCKCKVGSSGDNCEKPDFTCSGKAPYHPTACSAQGSCVGPNNCSCLTGYVGKNCEYYVCFGVGGYSPSTCSGRGSCVGINVCNCSQGFQGANCDTAQQGTFVCNQRTNLDAQVCSGHGACVASEKCTCETGYTGTYCQTPICFGKTGSSACSTKGKCVAPNTCTCDTLYSGSDCSNFKCYGIEHKNASVCTGGNCISPDTCTCSKSGYIQDCSVTKCGGILSSQANVCSGRGKCNAPNQCTCDTASSGVTCEKFSCYGFFSTDTAKVCSGHGTCSGPNNCQCATGYSGSKCEEFTCFGKARSDATVCSGKGECVGPDTCKCRASDATGYYHGSQCGACQSNYQPYPACNTKFCSDSTTCNGRGTCNSNNTCDCPSSASTGFWAAPFCATCQANYYGGSCKTRCVPKETCSDHGTCKADGTCACYSSRALGFFQGTSCNQCQTDVYGALCKTEKPHTFKISDNGNSIVGTFYVPVKSTTCAKAIHPSDLPALGSGARCSIGDDGLFSIFFGSNPSFKSGDTLRFNTFIADDTSSTSYISVVVAGPTNPGTPVAKIYAPAVVSVCDDLKLTAPSSSSTDGRPLVFKWSCISGDGDTIITEKISSLNKPTVTIRSLDLTPGTDYTFQLIVSNYLGVDSPADTATVRKGDSALVKTSIRGPRTRSAYRSKFIQFDGLTEIGNCFYPDRTIITSWRQVSGPNVDLKTTGQALTFRPNTLLPQESTYVFEFSASPKANPSSITSAQVTLNVLLSPLTATIVGGDSSFVKGSSIVLDASTSLDPDATPDTPVFVWSCRDSETGGFCPSSITNVVDVAAGSKITIVPDQVGTYLVSVAYYKDGRVSTATSEIEILAGKIPTIAWKIQPKRVVRSSASKVEFEATVTSESPIQSCNWFRNGISIGLASSLRTPYLSLSTSSLLPGVSYTVSLRCTNSEGTVSALSQFKLSTPPQPGSIRIADVGAELITDYRFVANNWISESPLTYQWNVYYKSNRGLIAVRVASPSQEFITRLPAGDLIVQVTVYDELEDSTTQEMEVSVPAASDEEIDDFVSNWADSFTDDGTSLGDLEAIDGIAISLRLRQAGRRIHKSSKTPTEVLTDVLNILYSGLTSIDDGYLPDISYFGQSATHIRNIMDTGIVNAQQVDKLLDVVDFVVSVIPRNVPPIAFTELVVTQFVTSLADAIKINSERNIRCNNYINKIVTQLSSGITVPDSVVVDGSVLSVGYAELFPASAADVGTLQLADSRITLSDFSESFTDNSSVYILAKYYDLGYAPFSAYPVSINSKQSSPSITLQVQNSVGTVLLGTNNTFSSNVVTFKLPASFDLATLRTTSAIGSSGFYPSCKFFDGISYSASQCTVDDFTSSWVQCSCKSLGSFTATYDFQEITDQAANEPVDVVIASSKKVRSIRDVIVAVLLGVGLPAVILVFGYIALVIVYVKYSFALKRKQAEKEAEKQQQQQQTQEFTNLETVQQPSDNNNNSGSSQQVSQQPIVVDQPKDIVLVESNDQQQQQPSQEQRPVTNVVAPIDSTTTNDVSPQSA